MEENFYNKNYEGVFWLPKDEESQILGTLYIDKEGNAKIYTLQNFDKDINDDFDIYGHISDNINHNRYSIKLYNANLGLRTFSSLEKKSYISNDIYISSFDDNISLEGFESILLRAGLLNRYVSLTGLKIEKTENTNFTKKIDYNQPESINLFVNDDYHIYLYPYAYSIKKDYNRTVILKENIQLNIDCLTEQYQRTDLLKIIDIVSNLFSLLWNSPVNFPHIELRSFSNSWYRKLKSNTNKRHSDTGGIQMIKYQDFISNSQNIFGNWFSKQAELSLMIKSFFLVYHQKGILHENKFITYISVLENYFKANEQKNKSEAEQIIDSHYINEENPKRKKITNLINILIYLISKSSLSKAIDDIKTYSIKLKETRAHYAHLEEKEDIYTLNEIPNENIRLEYLIREILLNEIEVKTPDYIHCNYKFDIDRE